MVDLIAGCRVVCVRNLDRWGQGLEGPVTFVLTSLQDPLVKELLFLGCEREFTFGRWHDINGVIAVDTPVDFGLFEISRGQPDKAIVFPGGFLKGIKPEI